MNRTFRHIWLLWGLLPQLLTAQLYIGQDERVHFTSNAPLELIEATSNQLRCAIQTDDQSFAFRLRISSFLGFNSDLQRQHFNENYLESNRFPEATFRGKIIERVDLSVAGTYNVRAKGTLSIHGQRQERIIQAQVISDGLELQIRCNFTVPLADHNIDIPRVVNQKIADLIQVEVTATLKREP